MPGPLGEFELVVLMAVAHQQRDGYGPSIRREIESRTHRRVGRGAVYVTLDRLEAKRLVASTLGEPLAQRGGRARRTYALTAAGVRALRAGTAMFSRMQAGLEPLLRKP
jgi:DNA-binding PadR family transcriptional regulator